MSKRERAWTAEQRDFIWSPMELTPGKTVIVDSYSGSGKSSVAACFMEIRPKERFLYTVLNVSMSEQAQDKLKDIDHVNVFTFHALAYDFCKTQFGVKECNTDQAFIDGVLAMSAEDGVRVWGSESRPTRLGLRHLMTCITEYCHSSARDMHDDHFRVFWPTNRGNLGRYGATMPSVATAKNWARCLLDAAWSHRIIPPTFDMVLKFMQLRCENLGDVYTTCVIDEAQDVFPVVFDLLRRQNWAIILIGDSRQQINKWLGNSNSMGSVSHALMSRFVLSQSFRFGNNIARFVNGIFDLSEPLDRPMTGLEKWTRVDCLHRLNTQVADEEGYDEDYSDDDDDDGASNGKDPDIIRLSSTSNDAARWSDMADDEDFVVIARHNMALIETMISMIPRLRTYLDTATPTRLRLANSLRDALHRMCALCECDSKSLNNQLDVAQDERDDTMARRIQYVLDRDCALLHRQLSFLISVCVQDDASSSSSNGNFRTCHLTSAHSSKGLEWRTVLIHHDLELCMFRALGIMIGSFSRLTRPCDVRAFLRRHLQETNEASLDMDTVFLVYVAITRCMTRIMMPSVMYQLYSFFVGEP